ncbi:MAG TPA: glutamate racemase [Anaerolineales bacterium]|nr:glutamate racemase [Anaerolineales bacterium]HMR98918.1 glutamate racemase [Anaerolineales bacterium]HNQ93282.1 glutamate racemase [Anaerolineales bacterium]HNS59853.1 glutamate racemase [Anaerolineales bacterium]
MNFKPNSPIGIFDSGIGGLSVLRAIRRLMPGESIIYFGDQIHIPYGPRPMEQIGRFSEAITNFLIQQQAKIVVVACNTASAAALKDLRAKFPEMQFVGMEPAVKPAAERTQTGRVGVLATPATFQGALYASVVERFANGVELFQNTCPGLVQQIEQGNLDGKETRQILENALFPMLERNIDTVVLGCTHYPFVIPMIEQIVGENVRVIDPAPAVAKQTNRLLETGRLVNPTSAGGNVKLFTSGNVKALQSLLPILLGESAVVNNAEWIDKTHIRQAHGFTTPTQA